MGGPDGRPNALRTVWRRVPNAHLLRDHREGAHGNRCPDCGADFTTEALLANHRESYHGRRDDEALARQQGELKP